MSIFDVVEVHVEVGWTSPPGTALADIDWVDISGYVHSASIGRGRSSELDSFVAGRCTLVLNNEDRRFDPTYTAGPYYPNVKPMRPVRVYATYNSTDYPLFMGFGQGHPQEYPDPNYSLVQLQCVDGFEILNQAVLPLSVWQIEVEADNPTAWYKLAESSGITVVDSSGNKYDATFEGDVYRLSAAPLFDYNTEPVLSLDGEHRAVLPTAARITTTPYSIEFVAKLGAFDTAEFSTSLWRGVFDQGQDPGDGILIGFFYFSLLGAPPFFDSFQFLSSVSGTLRTTTSASFTTAVDLGVPHHYVLVDTGSTLKVYIDGVNVTGSVTSSGVVATGPNAYIGGTTIGDLAGAEYLPFLGELGHVIIYGHELSSARVLAHYQALTAPWDGDTTGERLEAMLDEIDHPSADRDIDTGISTLGPARLNGAAALGAMKNVEKTEGGRLYMSADGKVVFRNRHQHLLDTTVVATWGEDGAAGELPYFSIATDDGVSKVRNVVSANRDGGDTIMVDDASSITDNLRRSYELGELEGASDAEVRARIEWELDHYKDPFLRIEQLVMKPYMEPGSGDTWTADDLWSTILGLDIDQRHEVKRRPQNVGDAIDVTVLVERVEHRIDAAAGEWITGAYLSPADDRDYWILGTSELGSGTRLGY